MFKSEKFSGIYLAMMCTFCFVKNVKGDACSNPNSLAVENETILETGDEIIYVNAYSTYNSTTYVTYCSESECFEATNCKRIDNPSGCTYTAAISGIEDTERELFVVFTVLDSAFNIIDFECTKIIHQKSTNITLQGTSLYIEDSESKNISCLATGNPPPILRWEREDDSAQSLVTYEIQHNATNLGDVSGELILALGYSGDGVGFQDAGNYICTGYNEAVDGRNDTDSKKIAVFVEASVKLQSSSTYKEVIETRSVDFYCQFQGYPLPDVTWYINEDMYTGTPTIDEINEYTVNATLRIDSVSCADEGLVKCVAGNTLSSGVETTDSSTMQLKLIEPSGVEDLNLLNSECDGSILYSGWSKPSDWSGELQYILTLYEGTNVERNITTNQNNYNFTNLHSNTNYEIEVFPLSVCDKKGPIQSRSEMTSNTMGPDDVTNVLSNLTHCQVVWTTGNDLVGVIRYEIKYNFTKVDSSVTGHGSASCTEAAQCLYYMDEPNALYSAGVSAVYEDCESAFSGNIVGSNCISDTVANTDTNPPTSDSDVVKNCFDITVPPYDQSDGTISCYFVVMAYFDKNEDIVNFTGDLNSVDSYASDPAKYYFESASSEWVEQVNIGCNTPPSTQCKPLPNGDTTYNGTSTELLSGKIYNIHIVTTVPSTSSFAENEYKTGISEPLVIVVDDPGLPTWAIILIVIGSVAALVGIICIVKIVKNAKNADVVEVNQKKNHMK